MQRKRGSLKGWAFLCRREHAGKPNNNGPAFFRDVKKHHPRLTATDRVLSRGIEQPRWGRVRRGRTARMVQIPVEGL